MKKLNIYFTAGFPELESTTDILKTIQNAGADMVEIGMPYSDPIADGEIIQQAHQIALQNGMTIEKLFEQLIAVKNEIKIPIILMGYINPVLRFGFEKFCQKCQEAGVSGLILPDLPPYEFEKNYRSILEKYHLNFIFLITPETSQERILYLDQLSSGFLYAVSSSSTTGNSNKSIHNQDYLEKLSSLQLKNPILIGFGIKNKQDFNYISQYAEGGIIGSAFVKILLENKNWKEKAEIFVKEIKN